MSISAAIERSLFTHKDGGGGTTIIKHRFLSFLIWQSIQSTLLLLLTKTLFLSPFTSNPFSPSFLSLLTLLFFHFSLLLYSISLFFLSSPRPLPFATPAELSISFLRLLLASRGDHSLRRRVRVSLSFVLFLGVCGLVGAVSIVCVCWGCSAYYDADSVLGLLGVRGIVMGFLYGLHYLYHKRWVLRFPIIQRPPFFGFKIGIPSSVGRALRLSVLGYLISLLAFLLPIEYRNHISVGKFVVEQITFYIGSFTVILCWELNHHLHQVLHTKRFVFAPPKGSQAAIVMPNVSLLEALEESTPNSLLQHLAYLDLCMVCESNVDTWRRAAIFEQNGEYGDTYRRVITACLKPLEQFSQKLAEGLETSSAENSLQLSYQLSSPTERLAVAKLYESFYDSQLCAWSARIVASLTARSRKEDTYGAAQLSGSNSAVISTLLSCLLAVETLLGKKTNIQSTNYSMGPSGIKWATVNTGRGESTAGAMIKIRGSPLYGEAYSLADVLKTSIYYIVSTFHGELSNSSKAGLLEKDWITSEKPVYGSRELLIQKLRFFLDFQA